MSPPRPLAVMVGSLCLVMVSTAPREPRPPTIGTPPVRSDRAGTLTRRLRAPVSPGPTPTLLVVLTVDQMRPDYFTRFGGQFTGGLRRLYNGGAVFTDAHQDHAITETAPGHAAILSGRFPRSTGIVRNDAGVQDSTVVLLGGSPAGGASPVRFRGTTLVDWLSARAPPTRALSVSRKDRGAILPFGRAKQHVFWWGPDGAFTTSTYYADSLPDWVKQFNGRRAAHEYARRDWTLLLADSAYAEPDSVPVENEGDDFVFPHRPPADPVAASRQITRLPWMDQLTLDVALAGLAALNLGRGPHTDVLAVSLSSTDAIGHRYGPDSREVHDQILRLDRMLAVFIDSLYAVRDSARIAIVLTADHGVAPYPELRFLGTDPERGRADVQRVVSAHQRRLAAAGVDPGAVDIEDGMLFLDRAALARARLDADSALRALLADVRRVPGVQRADGRAEFARRATRGDAIARRWLHAIPADLDVAAAVTLRPNWYWAHVRSAAHGSPHRYDTHVPLIFYGPPFRRGSYGGFVRVVDGAPTLAAALRVRPAESLDGRVLTRVLQP